MTRGYRVFVAFMLSFVIVASATFIVVVAEMSAAASRNYAECINSAFGVE